MSRVWFTSDTHYDHANIIRYCNRPFRDVDDMNEGLIAAHNERVAPDDLVYHLGDFAFSHSERIAALRRRLNGRIHLILGNHDRLAEVRQAGFHAISQMAEVRLDGQSIVLCHYAMRVWNKSHRGALMLYGHSHATLPGDSQSQDVGVDASDYRPVALDEILARMAKAPPYQPGDHHGSQREAN